MKIKYWTNNEFTEDKIQKIEYLVVHLTFQVIENPHSPFLYSLMEILYILLLFKEFYGSTKIKDGGFILWIPHYFIKSHHMTNHGCKIIIVITKTLYNFYLF